MKMYNPSDEFKMYRFYSRVLLEDKAKKQPLKFHLRNVGEKALEFATPLIGPFFHDLVAHHYDGDIFEGFMGAYTLVEALPEVIRNCIKKYVSSPNRVGQIGHRIC